MEGIDNTAVTSVTATDDDMQFKIPSRNKGSYGRVEFDKVETTIKSAQERGFDSKKIYDFKKIHDDIIENVPKDCEFKYWEWGISIKASGRKFLTYEAFSLKKNHKIFLLKTHVNKYKIPRISGLVTRHNRIYKGVEKPDSAAYCEIFDIIFINHATYNLHKNKIHGLINLSYDMATKHVDKILKINPRKKIVISEIENIDTAQTEFDKFAKKDLAYQFGIETFLKEFKSKRAFTFHKCKSF